MAAVWALKWTRWTVMQVLDKKWKTCRSSAICAEGLLSHVNSLCILYWMYIEMLHKEEKYSCQHLIWENAVLVHFCFSSALEGIGRFQVWVEMLKRLEISEEAHASFSNIWWSSKVVTFLVTVLGCCRSLHERCSTGMHRAQTSAAEAIFPQLDSLCFRRHVSTMVAVSLIMVHIQAD